VRDRWLGLERRVGARRRGHTRETGKRRRSYDAGTVHVGERGRKVATRVWGTPGSLREAE
jgi:hypothetical protein